MNKVFIFPFPKRCTDCSVHRTCLFSQPELLGEFEIYNRSKTYGRGTLLYQQGDDVTTIHILCSGWVKIFALSKTGKRQLLRVAGPTDFLGLSECLSGFTYRTAAEVAESAVIMSIDARQFWTFICGKPSLSIRLLETISKEVRRLEAKLCEFSGKLNPQSRLLHLLQEYAESCGHQSSDGIKLCVPFTVQDLADAVGYSRQWTTRLLADLTALGRIRRKGGWLILSPKLTPNTIGRNRLEDTIVSATCKEVDRRSDQNNDIVVDDKQVRKSVRSFQEVRDVRSSGRGGKHCDRHIL